MDYIIYFLHIKLLSFLLFPPEWIERLYFCLVEYGQFPLTKEAQ